jgi:UDP:flavonoid glycosyltransferase YjiC (YdhE family)
MPVHGAHPKDDGAKEKKMKIIIPTIGTRGDVQPYIALALGLQNAGHSVTLATHPCMRGLVESYQVEFAPIGPDIDIAYETAVIRGKSPNWMVGFMRVMKFSFSMLEKSHADLLKLCQGVDLVIVSHTAAGSMEADQLGLPTISVTLTPEAIPAKNPNASLISKGVMKVAGAGMGLVMSRPLNQIRKRIGLPPMGPTGITSPTLNLIPISAHVTPPNPLWEPRHQMTGYWFAPSPETWSPPSDLEKFLQGGEPPAVISLGAMALSGEDALEAAQITLSAVEKAGVRAVIQGWDEPMKTLTLPDSVFHAGSVPHEWLLPRASALVHHGGFGTTSAGFRAGIPSLVIPHIIDQFLWGKKVADLGVGPQPIARTKLTVEAMTDALLQMKTTEMKSRAADLGNQIRQEDGVARAVELIEAQCR